jgi:membrane protease YdiL (CAAX protease family)
MVPDKPWKMEGMLRLIARVLMGMLLLNSISTLVIHFVEKPAAGHALLFSLALVGAVVAFTIALVSLGRSWQPENLLVNLITVLACFYVGFLLMLWAQKLGGGHTHVLTNDTIRLIVGAVSFQGAAIVWVHLFLKEHGISWTDAFGLRNRPIISLLMGSLVGLVFLPIGSGLQAVSVLLMQYFRIELPEQQAVQILRGSEGWATRLVLGITAIVLAPVAEELLFRGILYPTVKQAGFPRLAYWISAVAFGAIHLNLASFVALTAFALALVWLYEHTENVLAAVTAHSVFNTINFILACLYENSPPTHLQQ